MLTDYRTLVIQLVRDDAQKIQPSERDLAIDAAVKRYSSDRPVEKAEDVTPASANLLPLPASWETDFSTLLGLEHPIGNVPPSMLSQDRAAFYRSPAGVQIQVLDAVAVAASSVRVTFTVKHTLSLAADTIPDHHREPVACWAAALLCDQLAAFYSGGTDSSIQADSVQQRTKAQEYSSRAKVLRKRYHDELGIEPKRSEPAGQVVQMTQPDSWGGARLNHPAQVR